MSKFTKDAPLEFEGVKVWRDGDTIRWDDGTGLFGTGFMCEGQLRKYAAFIEAERNEWAWTNDEHTEARKGRWTVKQVEGRTLVQHDDMGLQVLARHDSISWEHTDAAADIAREFAAWHAALPQEPAEPTGLGAVVKVGDEWWVQTDDISCRWMSRGGSYRCHWKELLTRGPVTILSPGVDA